MIKDIFLGVVIGALRLGAVLYTVPFFNTQVIQGLARNAVALSLSLMVIPLVIPQFSQENLSLAFILAVVAKEIFLGFIMGFLAAIPFWLADSVGFFIDNQRGSAMASSFDPMVGGQTTPFGVLMVKVAVTIFFSSGGLIGLLTVIYASYALWPPLSFFPTLRPNFVYFFLDQGDRLIDHIVLVVSPILICMFLTDFGLGLVNRFAPQLNVFFLSMPIKSALACFVLLAYLATIIYFLKDEFGYSHDIIHFLETLLS